MQLFRFGKGVIMHRIPKVVFLSDFLDDRNASEMTQLTIRRVFRTQTAPLKRTNVSKKRLRQFWTTFRRHQNGKNVNVGPREDVPNFNVPYSFIVRRRVAGPRAVQTSPTSESQESFFDEEKRKYDILPLKFVKGLHERLIREERRARKGSTYTRLKKRIKKTIAGYERTGYAPKCKTLTEYAHSRMLLTHEQAERYNEDLELGFKIASFWAQFFPRELTLRDCWDSFIKKSGQQVGFGRFARISKLLGVKYLEKREAFDDTPAMQENRRDYVEHFQTHIQNSSDNWFFFDVTSFSESSFKKKYWSYPVAPNRYRKQFCYNLTHMLYAINLKGNFYALFIKGNMNAVIVRDFFSHMQEDQEEQGNQMGIILDNTPMHYHRCIKLLAIQKRVKFVFLPVKSPYLNLAEFAFRFCKTALRKSLTLR
jgi:transposase